MSKKEKYLVFDDEDNLEYIIKVKKDKHGTAYKMYRSKSDHWNESAKGEWVEHWFDNGNGFEGLDIEDKHTDYDKLERVKIMIKFIHKYDKNLFSKFKIRKK